MFHCYLFPERSVPADALAVHGLSAEFLADTPQFAAVADALLAFIGDAPLVAHNAGFDIAFLNAELKRSGKPPIVIDRVIDTLVLARRKHAGGLTLDLSAYSEYELVIDHPPVGQHKADLLPLDQERTASCRLPLAGPSEFL